MKAGVFHGARDVRCEDVPEPELGEGEALIRVRACGICGSDLHTYREGLFQDLALSTPAGRILGHEFAGEIVAINGDMQGLTVGDRVTVPGLGANAEYVKIPTAAAGLCLPLADDVSYTEAATTEPLATSLHAVNIAEVGDGETVVIMGAGIIGLGILQCIRARSTARTVVVDLSDKRLALAAELGADETVNARDGGVEERLMAHTGAAGELLDAPRGVADLVFDCVGVTANFTGTSVLEQALAMVKPRGTVVVVAVFERPLEIDANLVVRKGVRLLGSWAWSGQEFVDALELISSGKVDRRALISHEFSLEQVAEAYATQASTDAAIKVMLVP